ncbi:MAG: NAD-dependent epimerase [Myxococcota bacterium]|nr:NAD-dependent epimerase [Myxococcota bacterium]
MKVLVTGSAGFIGSAVASRLLDRGDTVLGIDSLNDYYDVRLKEARRERLVVRQGYQDHCLDIAEAEDFSTAVREFGPERIVHMAAQAGVRYSIEAPEAYVRSNLVGFLNVLEVARELRVEHLVYASSSSVYGANETTPFTVHDNVDHPISFYAATKKSNELMAHSYSHLYDLPTTGLRFFTVYGPWGRPDMSPFIFAGRILAEEPIDVFNYGEHVRDFTFIDDIVEGVLRALDRPATASEDWNGKAPDPGTSRAPYRLYNIGSNSPVELLSYIKVMEDCIGRKAILNKLPRQPGDVLATYADVDELMLQTGYKPGTPLEVGMQRFVEWYRNFYDV